MYRRTNAGQTGYYHQQACACACAGAAATTATAEVRQAYLALEQGWLGLAPKPKENAGGGLDPPLARDADVKLPPDVRAR